MGSGSFPLWLLKSWKDHINLSLMSIKPLTDSGPFFDHSETVFQLYDSVTQCITNLN